MEIRAILWILIVLLISSPSFSFTLNNSAGAAFEQDNVSINVATIPCTNLGISNEELLNMANEAAIEYWNSVPTSRLTLERGSLKDVAAIFGTGKICTSTSPSCNINPALIVDSNILIACNTENDNFGSSSFGNILGVGLPNNIDGDKIKGALVLINDQASNSFKDKNRNEQVAILAHEIGHAIGLGHSQYDRNLMYHQSISVRKALGPDDHDGMTWLYPTEQPFGGCGTIELKKQDFLKQGLFSGILGFFFIILVSRRYSAQIISMT